MRKTKIALFAIPVLAAVMIGATIAPVLASGPSIGMAWTATGFVCAFPGPDGLVLVSDPDNIVVESNDKNNHIKLHCHAEGVPNSTDKAYVVKGLPGCGIFTDDQSVVTDNTLIVVSADGEANVYCQYRD